MLDKDGLPLGLRPRSSSVWLRTSLEEKSVAKQFTYARDMLQLDLDLFLYDKGVKSLISCEERRVAVPETDFAPTMSMFRPLSADRWSRGVL